VVYREVCTEGSETTKVGTDPDILRYGASVQKLDMRHNKSDKQAHHCNVQTQEVEHLLC